MIGGDTSTPPIWRTVLTEFPLHATSASGATDATAALNLQAVAFGIGDCHGGRSLQCLSQDALTPPGPVPFVDRQANLEVWRRLGIQPCVWNGGCTAMGGASWTDPLPCVATRRIGAPNRHLVTATGRFPSRFT